MNKFRTGLMDLKDGQDKLMDWIPSGSGHGGHDVINFIHSVYLSFNPLILFIQLYRQTIGVWEECKAFAGVFVGAYGFGDDAF